MTYRPPMTCERYDRLLREGNPDYERLVKKNEK